MNEDTETEQSEPQRTNPDKRQCACQGKCTCGTKYKSIRPVYYEVNVTQILNNLNDWD